MKVERDNFNHELRNICPIQISIHQTANQANVTKGIRKILRNWLCRNAVKNNRWLHNFGMNAHDRKTNHLSIEEKSVTRSINGKGESTDSKRKQKGSKLKTGREKETER